MAECKVLLIGCFLFVVASCGPVSPGGEAALESYIRTNGPSR